MPKKISFIIKAIFIQILFAAILQGCFHGGDKMFKALECTKHETGSEEHGRCLDRVYGGGRYSY